LFGWPQDTCTASPCLTEFDGCIPSLQVKSVRIQTLQCQRYSTRGAATILSHLCDAQINHITCDRSTCAHRSIPTVAPAAKCFRTLSLDWSDIASRPWCLRDLLPDLSPSFGDHTQCLVLDMLPNRGLGYLPGSWVKELLVNFPRLTDVHIRPPAWAPNDQQLTTTLHNTTSVIQLILTAAAATQRTLRVGLPHPLSAWNLTLDCSTVTIYTTISDSWDPPSGTSPS
jgi:hypothetical protein